MIGLWSVRNGSSVGLGCPDAQQTELGLRCCSAQGSPFIRPFQTGGHWAYLPIRSSQIGQCLLKMLHLHLRPGTRETIQINSPASSRNSPFTSESVLTVLVPPYISRSPAECLARAAPDSYILSAALGRLPRMVVERAEPATPESACATAKTNARFNDTEKPKRKHENSPCHSPDLSPAASSSIRPPTVRLLPLRHPYRPFQAEGTVAH